MFSNDSIGQWSVAIGQDTLATGEGAMAIGSPSSNASGSYSGLFSTSKSIINGIIPPLFSTKKLSSTSIADSIIFKVPKDRLKHLLGITTCIQWNQFSDPIQQYLYRWMDTCITIRQRLILSHQRVPSVLE